MPSVPALHQPLADALDGLTDQILSLARATEDNAIDHQQPLPPAISRAWQLRLDQASQALQNATHRPAVREAIWSPSMTASELI